MSFDNTGKIGAFPVAASADKLQAIADYAKGLGHTQMQRFVENPASFVVLPFPVAAVAADSNVDTPAFRVPFPLRVLEVQAAADFGAGVTAATAQVNVDRAPAYAGAASILAGGTALDVFAAGDGLPAVGVCEDGSQDLAYGDRITVNLATAGGAAGLTNGVVHLICQRL